MVKQYTIIDPITLKKYIFNFNELRMWLDVKTFENTISKAEQYIRAFDTLNSEEKESVLKLIDRHDGKMNFPLNKWLGIPGLDVSTQLDVIYNPHANIFIDKVAQLLQDKFFYDKQIYIKTQQGNVIVNDNYFPLKAIWGMSADFCYVEDIPAEEMLPLFDRYMGCDSDGTTRLLIGKDSGVTPIQLVIPVFEEEGWIYQLTVTISSTIDWSKILWQNVPKIKRLYEFFYYEGFEIKGDGVKRTIWERDGDIIEYNQTPYHHYLPFILIKQSKGKKDAFSRIQLGTELLTKIKEKGFLEDIFFYEGTNNLVKALDRLGNVNKKICDEYIIRAEEYFKKCVDFLWPQAQSQIVLCEYLKTKIAEFYEDESYKQKANLNIARIFRENRCWSEIAWYLDFKKRDKFFTPVIIKELVPMKDLDMDFFMDKETKNELLSLWAYFAEQEKCPEDQNKSQWYYSRAVAADSIGLDNIAAKKLKAFFRTTQRDPQKSTWAEAGTEDLLDLAERLNCSKEYLRFAQSMANHFKEVRRNQSIGATDQFSRKNYRWNSFVWCIAESRWSFHSAYLLAKAQKPNPQQIQDWYDQSYESFSEAMLFIDLSDSYTDEQYKVIAHGLITAYNMGFYCKDYEMMDYSRVIMKNLWGIKPEPFIYQIINPAFTVEERSGMADYLVDKWIQNRKQVNKPFVLTQEMIKPLTELYLSVGLWSDAAKTLDYGFENFTWKYSDFSDLYSLFRTLKLYEPDDSLIAETQLWRWIDFFIAETNSRKEEMALVISQIKEL